jgi:hypothetical protein
MTTHTPAPAQQAVLTDDEMIACFKDAMRRAREQGLTDAGPHEYVAAGAVAMLSKLRAPVARTADQSVDMSVQFVAGAICRHLDMVLDPYKVMTAALVITQRFAALASAPVSDSTLPLEKALHELVSKIDPGLDTGDLVQDAGRASALLSAIMASAPVAGEAKEALAPLKCPITGRPFFMAIKHPEFGMVPTYGGPYDSYTIPHLGGKPDQPWHERELRVYRYDHDLGGWLTDEVEVIPLRIVREDVLHALEDAAPQASEAVRNALMAFDEAMNLCEDFPELQHHRDALLFAVQKARAALSAQPATIRKPLIVELSAQPGAQKESRDAE